MHRYVVLLALCLLLLCGLSGDTPEHTLQVTMTAYGPSGRRSASGAWPAPGTLALSMDVEHSLMVHFGEQVCVTGVGRYTFADRMPRRWARRIDLFMPTLEDARRFGVRRHVIIARCPTTQ